MSRVRLFVSLLILLGAVAALADDPPSDTVVQRPWLRPCLDTGSVTHDQYEYKCTSSDSNVQVYNFYTRNEYLKDAVYRVDRTQSNFYAYAVKQSLEVARTTMLDSSAALVTQREVPKTTTTSGWVYKKKE